MNINKFSKIALITALGTILASCSLVPAGNVGVKVELLGGEKGVGYK